MGKTTSGGGLSLRTADATKGGGTEGALATITEINFVDEFTYGGRQKDNPQAALNVVFEIEGFEKPWDQNYTIGPSDKYEVIEDGDGIRSKGKGTGLNEKCSAYAFFAALEAAAAESDEDLDELLPEIDGGGNSVRPLEGRQVRLTNVKFETVGGDKKELIVIGSFEAEDAAPAKGKGGSGKAASVKGAKSKGGPSLDDKTIDAIKALLADKSPIKKGDLANLVYQDNKKDADVKAMMNLCFKESFLAEDGRPWEYDKKRGVLKATEADSDDE